jgi:hypothetical protein
VVAMETLMHRLALSAVALSSLVLVAGCEAMPSYTPATVPSGAQAVPIRLLTARGIQGFPPPFVFAATSVPSLETLVDSQYCHLATGCASLFLWGPITGVTGDVLLALPDSPGYDLKSIAAWRSSRSTVTIAEGLVKTCQGGECTAAGQAMYLAAVPRAALPDATVSFHVAGESGSSSVDLDPGASPVPGA